MVYRASLIRIAIAAVAAAMMPTMGLASDPLPGDIRKNKCRQGCAVDVMTCRAECREMKDEDGKALCHRICAESESICVAQCR